LKNELMLAGDASLIEHQPDTLRLIRIGLKKQYRLAAEKLAVLDIYRKAKPSLHRIDLFIQLMTIQGHRRFEPESIAGTEAGGLDPERLTGSHKAGPKFGRRACREKQLAAIFAGIAGPADE
jgi:hypothetical protein